MPGIFVGTASSEMGNDPPTMRKCQVFLLKTTENRKDAENELKLKWEKEMKKPDT